MLVIRDHLVRHPDLLPTRPFCVSPFARPAPGCRPPYKFDPSRCLEAAGSAWTPAPPSHLCRVQEGKTAKKPLSGAAEDRSRVIRWRPATAVLTRSVHLLS